MSTAQVNASESGSLPEARASILNKFPSPHPNHADVARDVHVQTAGMADQPRLVAAVVLAFSTDPAARWTYPAPESYLKHFPDLVRAFGGRAVEYGAAHFIGDVQAAALWLPPGVQPDEAALMAHFQRTVPEQDQDTIFAIFEQMGHYRPDEPHWYLPMIGVDPAYQRKGYGSALLAHALRLCDAERTAAYLESSNPENIPLYRRHGFEVMGTIQMGTSPPITPMLRRPR